MIGKQIESILKNGTGIAAIVTAASIRPVSSPEPTLPAIYYIIKVIPHYNKGGQQTNDFKVTVWTMHKNYNTSWVLSLLIKEAFEAKRLKTVESVKIQKVECLSITDEYEFNINSFGQLIEFDIKTGTIAS